MLDFLNPTTLGVAGLIVVLLFVGIVIVKRYRIAEADEVIIVVGRKNKVLRDSEGNIVSDKSGVKVVRGGVFVLPFIQKSSALKLSSRKLKFQSGFAVTKTGITVDVEAVATIKVGDDEDSIRAAAQRFLHQQNEIEPFSQEQLQGELRAIVGAKTVEEIISDREGIAQAVKVAAESSLSKQGLVLDNFIIQSIRDEGSYISNLGRPKQAEVARAAEVAEADARRQAEEARISAETAVANAERELSLRQAAIKQEVDRVNAEAAAASPLAEAIQQQSIIEQQQLTAARQAELRERQLDTEVRKPADAEAYRQRQLAEAEAYTTRQEAQADRDRRLAEAEALRAEGGAEAENIRAKGLAEAEAIQSRADALREQGAAVLQQDLIKQLPEIAAQIAAPMGNIDQLTVVSTDGASAMGKTVANGITELPALIKGATGIDLTNIFSGIGTGVGMAAGAAGAQALAAAPAKPAKVVDANPKAAKPSTSPRKVTKAAAPAPPTEAAVDPVRDAVKRVLQVQADRIKTGVSGDDLQDILIQVSRVDPQLAQEAVALWQQDGVTIKALRQLVLDRIEIL